jgi:uncharacterized peroxidase-related enzyme
MPRLNPVVPQTAQGRAKTLLEGVQASLGVTPNMMRTMAQSPAVLEGYLGFLGALAKGSLSAKVREQIALTVAQANSCDYCLSVHAALGKGLGLTADDISRSRAATSPDPKVDAGLQFARVVVDRRGLVPDSEIKQLRPARYSDGEISELVANIAINVFTNYFNHIAGTEIDFPHVSAKAA